MALLTRGQLKWHGNSCLVVNLLFGAAEDPPLSIQMMVPLESRDTARLTRKQLE